MNVQRVGNLLLPEKTGDAGEIRVRNTGAIVTLRMTGVVTEHRERLIAVPEADQRDNGVNGPFRLAPQRGVGGRGPAGGTHFAVRPEDPPIGGHLPDWGLPEAQVRDRLALRQRHANRRRQSLQRRPGEGALVGTQRQATLAEQPFSRKVTVRGVMLVDGMDRHALRRRSRGLGQPLLEDVVTLVADPNPVDRTQNDRLAGAQQNHAATAQAEFSLGLDRVIGHHAAHRWGDVHVEHGQSQAVGPQRRREEDEGAGHEQRDAAATVHLHPKEG